MHDLVLVLTSWPTPVSILVVVALSLFRRQIASVIDRARATKAPGGIEISTAPKQDDALSPAKTSITSAATGAPFPQLTLKFDSVLVKGICDGLEGHVAATFKDDTSERERYLVRAAADAIATGIFEHIYTQIFGSQLAAVRDLNSAGVVPTSLMLPYFEKAKEMFPTMYENDTFDRWLAWLTNVAYLVQRHDDDRVSISDTGRDFLQYVVSRGYQTNKLG